MGRLIDQGPQRTPVRARRQPTHLASASFYPSSPPASPGRWHCQLWHCQQWPLWPQGFEQGLEHRAVQQTAPAVRSPPVGQLCAALGLLASLPPRRIQPPAGAVCAHTHGGGGGELSHGPLKTVEKAAFLLQCVHFCALSCCCLLRAPTRAAFQQLVLRMLSPLTCHLALFVCGDALAAPSPEGHIERHSVCVRSALLALPPPIAVNDSLLHQ